MPIRPIVCVIVSALLVTAVQDRDCPHCGKKLKKTAKFCGGCGKPVEAERPQDPPKEKPKPKGIEGVGLTAEQVNRAIDRGVDFLIAQYRAGKIENREKLLCALALLHARAFEKDKVVRDGLLKFVETVSINSLNTYNVGILAMVLDELGTHPLRLADCAKYFVETQGRNGSWAYGAVVPQIGDQKPKRRLLTVTGGTPIDEPGKPWIELRRENPPEFGHDGDNSTTQYAILGLRSAARRGIGIPKEVWERCEAETRKRMEQTQGGWAYSGVSTPYGSMTTAAGTTLAICAFHLGRDPAADEWVRRAAAWCGKNFSVQINPPAWKKWIGYYLYSLERFGVVLGDEFFGDHEWYPLGVRKLVDSQAGDGSWELEDENKPDLSTMFALLFLTRATPKLRVELKRGGSGTLETVATIPGSYVHIILDASGSMTKKIEGREKFDIARDAVAKLVEELPEGVWAGLRVYGHRKPAIDEAADTDSALEIPLAPLDRGRYLAKLRSLRCRGKTPLTHSIEQAAGDLEKIPQEASVTLILLTDGIESTRGAKPDRAAEKLKKGRPNLRLVVVGFDVNDQREQGQLRAISDAAKGEFISATDSATLTKGLSRGIRGGSSYVLSDGAGAEVLKGEFGDRHTLKEGKYFLTFQKGAQDVRQEIWINTDAVTRVVVDLYAEEGK